MPQQIELRNIALQAAQPLVHGVSLTLQRGRVLALVGGSGSGKSLTCAATLGILPAGVRQTAGEILADGKPVSPCALRGIKIATIMQNPRSAFNPLHTMHTHARETCLALGKPADDATLTAAIEALNQLGERVAGHPGTTIQLENNSAAIQSVPAFPFRPGHLFAATSTTCSKHGTDGFSRSIGGRLSI